MLHYSQAITKFESRHALNVTSYTTTRFDKVKLHIDFYFISHSEDKTVDLLLTDMMEQVKGQCAPTIPQCLTDSTRNCTIGKISSKILTDNCDLVSSLVSGGQKRVQPVQLVLAEATIEHREPLLQDVVIS